MSLRKQKYIVIVVIACAIVEMLWDRQFVSPLQDG